MISTRQKKYSTVTKELVVDYLVAIWCILCGRATAAEEMDGAMADCGNKGAGAGWRMAEAGRKGARTMLMGGLNVVHVCLKS